MKQFKVILSLVIVWAVLFASVVSVSAIEFSAEEKYESVFVISSGFSLGSGFAVGCNCIVTNAHVIQNPLDVTVRSYDGTECRAQVIGMDEKQDIAVLVVSDGEFPVLTIADAQTMNIGDDVYAIGAPKSMEYTLTKGVVSAKEREIGRYRYVQTDAPINEGNSGGPLLNAAGEVIGMNTLKMDDSEGIGLAIPVTRICDYLKEINIPLEETGNVSGRVEPTEEIQEDPVTEPTEDTDKEDAEHTLESSSSETFDVAWVIAGTSLVLNVLLLLLLLRKKEKTVTVYCDPRERTDFDIDILE